MAESPKNNDQAKGESGNSGWLPGFFARAEFGDGWLRRIAPHLALLVALIVGVWAIVGGLNELPVNVDMDRDPQNEESPLTVTPEQSLTIAALPDFATPSSQASGFSGGGFTRALDIHTIIPSRPRLDFLEYEVQQGDYLFGIADKYGLSPESILFSNYDVLEDNPHALQPGQVLRIPPVDGAAYTWHEGDTIEGVATFYGVDAREIIDWPGNNINPSLDLTAENAIEPGTVVMIPGGTREFRGLYAPRIQRTNPAAARILGEGYCGTILEGAIGTGAFIWPTTSTWISGYTFSAYHPAIDIGGSEGSAIYASDNGVVVYSGWNNWGYGYVIVLDHGTGWQTLYAHLSSLAVGCGQSVFQGTVIGGMGCTGNCTGTHLHYEMQSDLYGKVNPQNFLP